MVGRTVVDMECEVVTIGGTGTIGSRVTAQLRARGLEARPASRRTTVPFDWAEASTWRMALDGVERIHILLPEQIAMPAGFLDEAWRAGVRRVVLSSDYAVDLMSVAHLQDAERQLRLSKFEWVFVRPNWFNQDFETFFLEPIRRGRVLVPVGDTRQGFVDADDIAAVTVEALLRSDLIGETLTLTGPRALTFNEALTAIESVAGHHVEFDGTPQGYRDHVEAQGMDPSEVERLLGGFASLVAGGDCVPTTDVQDLTGRPARDFRDYVKSVAALGIWSAGQD